MRSIPSTVLALALLSPLAASQMSPPPSQRHVVPLDSGWVRNDTGSTATVFSETVEVPGSAWVRLFFDEATLTPGSTLRVTSLLDGAEQHLGPQHLVQWQDSTAYFNGSAVLVEIVAAPGPGEQRVVLRDVTAGVAPAGYESQCGPTDDRVPSDDPAVARLLPAGCTGWIIDDPCGCLLSAGHCNVLSTVSIVQFNVPLSLSNGTLVNPPPSDQYAIDLSSNQQNFASGNDFMYFGVFPNPDTGLTPFEAQSKSFTVVDPLPDSALQSIRITGYGVDTGSANQTQQTNNGRRATDEGTFQIAYLVDTEGGNSGSPIIHEQSGHAFGIHTNGGCNPGTGDGNWGTSYSQPMLQSALASPQGVCAKTQGSFYQYGVGFGGANVGTLDSASVPNAGSPVTLDVSGVPNGTGGLVWVSATATLTPILDGTLFAGLPSLTTFGVVLAGGSGSVGLNLPVSAAGVTVYWQAILEDASQPSGFALTNGLKMNVF
jgi:hypothetical protein